MIKESGYMTKAMILVRIALLLKLNVCQFHSLDEEHGLLVVHVIVRHSVVQLELLSPQLFHFCDDTSSIVTGLIISSGGKTHVSLGIDGVIEDPVGRRRY